MTTINPEAVSTTRPALEREQHPHRNLERNVEIVTAQERMAGRVGYEIVRTAAAWRHLDEAKLTLDADLLDDLGLASDDRDLRFELGVGREIGGRRRGRRRSRRRWWQRWRLRCLRQAERGRDERGDGNKRGNPGIHDL